jgi:hypothetical protein
MKLKFIVAGAMLAASFSASAATKDLGILDSTGFDTLSASSVKYAAGAVIDDLWTFHIDVPSSTSFGAQQTFSVAVGAIKDFAGELVGYGSFGPAVISGSQQNLSWAGNLAAGDYTVHITGTSVLRNTAYNATVSALPVPEPETYGMLLGGLALVGVVARRKAKKAA